MHTKFEIDISFRLDARPATDRQTDRPTDRPTEMADYDFRDLGTPKREDL